MAACSVHSLTQLKTSYNAAGGGPGSSHHSKGGSGADVVIKVPMVAHSVPQHISCACDVVCNIVHRTARRITLAS